MTTTLAPRPPRLYEHLADQLIDAITSERYGVGSFLPTEQVLARSYGTSRNVVREALKLLEARGLVEVLHGRGTRVLPRHRWQLLDQLVRLVSSDPQISHDIVEMRRILEVQTAELAAQRATPAQHQRMAAAIEAMKSASADPAATIEHDIEFHDALLDAAGNSVLPLMLQPVAHLLRATRLAAISQPGAIDRSIKDHERILREVQSGDSARARQAMVDHLRGVERDVERLLEPIR